jgi:hypothetical protein
LLGEERRQRAHQQEGGEVRRHHHRQPARRKRRPIEIRGHRLDEAGVAAPGQQAEGDRRGGRAQGRPPPPEADGAGDDGQRIEDGEDAVRAAGQVDEAGGEDDVGGDLPERDVPEVLSGPQQEGGDERRHVHAADDGVEPRLDGTR